MSRSNKLKYKDKSAINFVNQADPPFIQKMKEKLGYKPPPTVEEKFSTTADEGYIENDLEEDDLSRMKDEERPQVVILDTQKDLSEKELEAELEKKRAEEDRRKIEEGKIVFKKPVKRKEEPPAGKVSEKRRHLEEKKEAVVSDSRLLSFNADEEEDES